MRVGGGWKREGGEGVDANVLHPTVVSCGQQPDALDGLQGAIFCSSILYTRIIHGIL